MKTLKQLSALAVLMTTASGAYALEEGVITIWVQDRNPELLAEVTAQFTEDLGIEVVIENVDELTDKFQQAAATGDGPDIVLWAHDRFGEWASGGLISAVSPSNDITEGIIDSAWDAVSFNGRVWGYPVAVEAVALIYNTDLVDTPPVSFEEIGAMTIPDGVTRIMWDYNNTYFTFPLMMANGGFAFQKVDGVYDGTSTGVNNEGAMKGGMLLRSLIDEGIMPGGVDYGVMDGAMANGDVAMIINGPWSWGAYEDAGINIAVAPLPTIDGAPGKPFLGVQAFAVNAASPNKDLVVELLEAYILSDEGLATWNAQGALGVLADSSAGSNQEDPKIQATLAAAQLGVPMPSNPEMGAFWSAMEPALGNITTGAATVEDALNDAAARILGE